MSVQSSDKLVKRARRKYMNIPALAHLIALNSPLKAKYQATLGCSSRIDVKDGKTISRYCKRTWCQVCGPIRTAIRINNYKEQLEEINQEKGLQLTTLTCPNVPPTEIRPTIQKFRRIFRQFRNTYKKSTGNVFRGVYNFEITINPITGLFHPHIHIIHEALDLEETGLARKDGEEHTINELVEYWLKKNPDSSIAAQDSRECFDIIEGFKYQSKSIFAIKVNGKNQPFIPVRELDTIYQAIQGLRCFQAFGINKIMLEVDEEKQMEELTAYQVDKPEGAYLWKAHDWEQPIMEEGETEEVDLETGEITSVTNFKYICLSGYVPGEAITELIENLQKNEYYKKRNNNDDNDSKPSGDQERVWSVYWSEKSCRNIISLFGVPPLTWQVGPALFDDSRYILNRRYYATKHKRSSRQIKLFKR